MHTSPIRTRGICGCVQGVASSQGVVKALHAHTSASAVIGTSGRARCGQDARQGGRGADRPCWHQAQRWCGILERTRQRTSHEYVRTLGCAGCCWHSFSATASSDFRARQRATHLADGAARPADAPPTGKRDPGDRAVRARAAALRSVSAVGVSLSRSSFIILEINRLQARFFTGLRAREVLRKPEV